MVVSGILATLALVPLAGFVWQRRSERRDVRRFPRPGRFVELDGEPHHVACSGSGAVTVILEAGIAASSVGWARVAPELADIAVVWAHDRPGFGWTPPSGKPRTPDQFVRELDGLVRQAGTPVILVGHSFGALLVRLYAAHHPNRVLGIVLADPALLLEWAEPGEARKRMLARGVRLARRGAFLAEIGFVRLSLRLLSGGARALPKLFSRMSSGGGAAVTERLVGEVRKLPPEVWPVVQSHWCRPFSFRSMAEHLGSLPAVAAAVAAAPPNACVPLTVISGGHLSPEQLAEHQQLAARSLRGTHVVASGSAHWIHLDRPDLIVEAVKTLIRNVASASTEHAENCQSAKPD